MKFLKSLPGIMLCVVAGLLIFNLIYSLVVTVWEAFNKTQTT